jgi:hypothetical protein
MVFNATIGMDDLDSLEPHQLEYIYAWLTHAAQLVDAQIELNKAKAAFEEVVQSVDVE